MSDETRTTLLHSSTNDLVEELLLWRGRAAELLDRIAELENEHNVWLIGASNAVKNLEARIAELEAERRWIPVSERLPGDTKRMLTIVYDAFEDTTAISILQHHGDGDWFSWDSGRYVVTHWMPLPESPVNQSTADSTDERKDDKLSEREVCEACGGDGTLLLVDNYKGQATATVDCPYCNCTGYVKECEE